MGPVVGKFARLFGWALILTTGAVAAHAASIDLDGVWGDKGGCEWARGIYDSDSAVVLRHNKLEGHEFMCDFVSAKRGANGSWVVGGVCAQEGTETRVQITISAANGGVRTIKANKGWRFPPVSRCKR